MRDYKTKKLRAFRKIITSKRSLLLMASLVCLAPTPGFANPSQAFKEKSDCLENPTFLTPNSQEFKYCLQPDGTYKTINQDGSYLKKEFEIDKPFEEREMNGLNMLTHSIEYKIEDNELVQYKCEAKRSGGKYVCKDSVARVLKGVRPDGYFLKAGLKRIEDEKWKELEDEQWKDLVEDFTAEIEISKNQDAYYQRAFAKLMLKDYLGAIKDSSSSLRLNKDNIKAYNVRSFSKYKIDDHKGAVNDLNKLITLLERLTDKESEELDIKELSPIYDKFYFRRALSNSELGKQNAAIQDFDQSIERDPLNGQAYFQRGLENYWTDRDLACTDMLKGLSLGAEDRSESLINSSTQETSFLEELFEKENTLMSSCKGVSQEKIDNNKSKFQREQLINEGGELFKKYLLVIPILLIVIVTIILKYTNNDE